MHAARLVDEHWCIVIVGGMCVKLRRALARELFKLGTKLTSDECERLERRLDSAWRTHQVLLAMRNPLK